MKACDDNGANGTLNGFEAGYDFKISQDGGNTVLAGFLVQTANGIPTLNQQTFQNGSGDQGAKAVGLYGIWLGDNGWYGDAVMRYHWLKNEVTSYSNFAPVEYKLNHNAVSLSLELGKRFARKDGCFMTPSAQVTFSYTDSDSFTSSISTGEVDSTTSYRGRLTVMLGRRIKAEEAVVQPYVKGGVDYEFDGKTESEYAGFRYEADALHGFRYELGAGVNAQFSEVLSVYADFNYEKNPDVQDHPRPKGTILNDKRQFCRRYQIYHIAFFGNGG